MPDQSSYLDKGIEAARSGNRLLARLHLLKAVDLSSKAPSGLLWLAWVAETPGDAVAHLETLLEQHPEHRLAQVGLAWARAMDQFDAAHPEAVEQAEYAFPWLTAGTTSSVPEPVVEEPTPAYTEPSYEAPTFTEPTYEAPVEEPPPSPSSLNLRGTTILEAPYVANSEYDAPDESVETPEDSLAEEPVAESYCESTVEPAWTVEEKFDATASELPPESYCASPPATDAVDDAFSEFDREPAGFRESASPSYSADVEASYSESLRDEAQSAGESSPDELLCSDEPAIANATTYEIELTAAPPNATPVTEYPVTEYYAEPEPEVAADYAADVALEQQVQAQAEELAGSLRESLTPALEPTAPPVVTPPAMQLPPAALLHPASAPARFGGPTIMVVDDSPTVRKLVAMTLETRQYNVVCVANGYEAVQKLTEMTPDLVLTDINMPRLDGYQLCKVLRKHPATRDIPVVMLSGKDGLFDKLRGKFVGCTDYITKPFDAKDLLAKVESHCPVTAT